MAANACLLYFAFLATILSGNDDDKVDEDDKSFFARSVTDLQFELDEHHKFFFILIKI
jgi:hypothetical protein